MLANPIAAAPYQIAFALDTAFGNSKLVLPQLQDLTQLLLRRGILDLKHAQSSTTAFSIPGNRLVHVPPSLSFMKDLCELKLSRNCLLGLPDTLFLSLRHLQVLDLSFNSLLRLPESIVGLSQLRVLNVSHNHLQDLPLLFGQLHALEDLDVSWNLVTGLPSTFVALKNLRRVNARGTYLSMDLLRRSITVLAVLMLDGGGDDYDIVAIGLQESTYKKKATSSPTHRDDVESVAEHEDEDDDEDAVDDADLHDVVLDDASKRKPSPLVSSVEKVTEATGVGNVIGNKVFYPGLVAEILSGARVGQRSIELDHQFDHAFWFGDMNYRVQLAYTDPKDKTKEEHWTAVHALVKGKEYSKLYANDQLQHQMHANKVLAGWHTAPCNFPPTFKRLRGKVNEFTVGGWITLYSVMPDKAAATTRPILLRPQQIKFYCTVPDLLLGDDGKHPQSAVLKGTLNPTYDLRVASIVTMLSRWEDGQIPALQLKCQLNQILRLHMILLIMDWDATSADDPLDGWTLLGTGQAVLYLPDCYEPGESVPFEVPVIRKGIKSGTIRGKVSIHSSGKRFAEWEKNHARVPGCACLLM
ncbi:hypothetical protein DYB32_001116 [Aphanomyces invadans]|uniref:Inositol polyphosphate-related phosphatase domain-containing protein n=1 Tax=Aphanomyces invadans TaxID=157072 RepID=A0A418B7I9_9STRA|nr:hypothetical protein DYB32_001116 [Aphanomyces invadans]